MSEEMNYQLDMAYTTEDKAHGLLMMHGDIGSLPTECIRAKPVRVRREYLKEAGQHAFIVDIEFLPDGSGAIYHLNDDGSSKIRQQFAACSKKKIPSVDVVVGHAHNLQCFF